MSDDEVGGFFQKIQFQKLSNNQSMDVAHVGPWEEQTIQEVKRDIENAKDDYRNRLDILALQEKNVITAQNNFDRSNEQYKLGQITSVELRQAQLNLLNAQTNKNFAKYDAKLAELQLLQLTGQLLNVEI